MIKCNNIGKLSVQYCGYWGRERIKRTFRKDKNKGVDNPYRTIADKNSRRHRVGERESKRWIEQVRESDGYEMIIYIMNAMLVNDQRCLATCSGYDITLCTYTLYMHAIKHTRKRTLPPCKLIQRIFFLS